ncbi:MAG TPA: TonB-dependent siderophore receptor [Caulobacter sp.]|nr:TonB-dependent siderophore receptor [Caulobacter sp.]
MRHLLFVAASQLVWLPITAARAQDAPMATAPEIEAVTVYGRPLGRAPGETATKTGAPIIEVPATINVVPRELLDLRGVSNIGEAAETISGVTRTIGFAGNQRFRIRGFSVVSTLRDGFRQSTSQPDIDLQGVDSIEVLKGPASALYGRFEPGGVINFVSKQPADAFAAEATVSGGSHDYFRGGLDMGGPLDSQGRLLGRLNLAYENADSFRDLVDNEQLFISPVVEWRPDDRTGLLVRLEYLERDAAFDRGLGNNPVFLKVPISRNYGEAFMRIRKEQGSGSVVLNRALTDSWRLRLGAFVSVTKVPEEAFFNYGFPALSGTTVNRNFSSYRERQEDSTVQAELYGRFATGPLSHRVLVGAERSRDSLAYLDGRVAFGQPIDLLNPVRTGRPNTYLDVGDSRYEYESTAIYLQDEIAWGRWRLLLGGRQEWTDTYAFSTGYVEPGVTRRDQPFSPRAGLTFLATPNLSVYASWTRSFRNEADGGLIRDGLTPKPTEGEQFEAGAKALLLDGRVEATLAAFDLTKTNVVVSDPADFSKVIQIGELKVRGIEGEVSARPAEPWTVVASYAYTDTEITRHSTPGLVGNWMPGVPRHQASLWTSWRFSRGTLGGLTVGGGVFHASRQAATTSNSFFLPAYVRIDVNAAYAIGERWEIRANIDNLTDEKIYITGGFSQVYPQAPRTARLTLTRRW